MHVAVFGGTGFVGSYLIDALLNARHNPCVLVRPGNEHKLKQAERCRITPGDIASESAIKSVLNDCDAVIYNIGILRENRRRRITFEELHYAAVERIGDAAKECGISRFLLMSANGVKQSGTSYQETKFRAEQYINSIGLETTIFRPSVIFGAPRGTMEIATQLYQQMVATPLPAIGFFDGWNPQERNILMSPVHVRDVANAFVNVLEDAKTIGNIYSLGGPEVLSWQEMIRRIAAVVGRDKWILPMPIALMKFAATLLDWLPFFPATADQLTMLAEGNTADSTVLAELIKREPRAFNEKHLTYLREK